MNVMPALSHAAANARSRTGSRSRDGWRRRRSRVRLRGSAESTGSFRREARGRSATARSASAHVQRAGIGIRVHRDGLDAQLAAGADDADGDLAAVGDQDLRDQASHRGFRFSRKARSPSWPSFETRRAAMAPAVSARRVERAARPHARSAPSRSRSASGPRSGTR